MRRISTSYPVCDGYITKALWVDASAKEQVVFRTPRWCAFLMDFLFEYLSFLANTVTIVIAVVIVLMTLGAMGRGRQSPSRGYLEVYRVNDRLQELRDVMDQSVMAAAQFKKSSKEHRKERKKLAKKAEPKPRVFVLDFKGDVNASNVEKLRNEVTAVLLRATDEDEVVVKVESPGGLVHAYGLAASQLVRVRQAGIRLTVAVDRLAASGGYMMAVVADQIIAAPFALVGSIGVVAEVPNVHRLLKKYDVDYDVITAGESKRTLTMFGENTEENRAKFVDELEDAHALFREFVATYRQELDVEAVATGEAWYGERAQKRNLVDVLSTSDEYVVSACDRADVYAVQWMIPEKPFGRLLRNFAEFARSTVDQVLRRQR
ncbi:MAG: protease SohB [Pseudomonadota bacterium]|nr:protease SohB [Pseudomonadota bacterium]